MTTLFRAVVCWLIVFAAPGQAQERNGESTSVDKTFAEDEAFLRQYTDIVTLTSPDGQAKVLVAPAWQGRVMTSTLAGDDGSSFGWINYDLVRKGIQPENKREGVEKHIYVFGGEERFWLGPEGGQYAIFFAPDANEYTFDNWKTPPLIDTVPFDVVSQTKNQVSFTKSARLTNKSGFAFDVKVNRSVGLLDQGAVSSILGGGLPEDAQVVAFKTENTLSNVGDRAWQEESGLLSIWLLGMLKHSDKSVVAIPLKTDQDGNAVRSDYFAKPGKDRLKTIGDVVYFKADGKFRSKIGIPPSHATPIAGSYDATTNTLTLIHYNLPANAASLPWVKSQWVEHSEPYAGDVINAYNDGPTEPGAKPLGPFYELESSSPALALKPNESYTHQQTTIHIRAGREILNAIAERTLHCTTSDIENAFGDNGS